MKNKISAIALVICIAMLLSACQAAVSLPVATPEAAPAVTSPSSAPSSAPTPTEAAPTAAPVAPATPAALNEATYKSLEPALAELLAAADYVAGDGKPAVKVEYEKEADNGLIWYTFEIEKNSVETEGVLEVAIKPTGEIDSYAVIAAATQTPVMVFVSEMSALLDEKKVAYELLGPGGSTYSASVGNPTFANLDYFWLDASTRVHSDEGEIESISLKFNKPIDETGKAILLTCIKSLSRYATMEELEAGFAQLQTDGQIFVGSCLVGLNGQEYQINLPDDEE